MRRVIIAALLLPVSVAAAPHRFVLHPNTELTIRDIAEYPAGTFWLATDDGLYTFDRVRYSKLAGYPFPAASSLAVTSSGAVWIGSRWGLTRFDGSFQVVVQDKITALTASGADVFFVRTTNSATTLSLIQPNDPQIIDLNKSAWLPHPYGDLIATRGAVWSVCHPRAACIIERSGTPQTKTIPIPHGYFHAAQDAGGRLWIADQLTARPADSSSPDLVHIRSPADRDRAGPLLAGRNGNLWFLGERSTLLPSGTVFTAPPEFESDPPTAGLEDAAGHLWVAYKRKGLLEWIADPNWERWSRGEMGGLAIAQVVRTGDEWVAAAHGALLRLDPKTREWRVISGSERSYDGILPLENGELLTASRELGAARLDRDGKLLAPIPHPVSTQTDFRKVARDASGRVWFGNRKALLRLDDRTSSYNLEQVPLPDVRRQAQAVDFDLDKTGRFWVGYDAGVAYLNPRGQWNRIAIRPEVRKVRTITVTPQAIWIAIRGRDEFFRVTDTGMGWVARKFDSAGGYGPPDTDFLKRDSRGWIWRGTPAGVSICDGIHFAPEDWIQLHANNGLASGEPDIYGFFEDRDGSIWISGDAGITHVRPNVSWFANRFRTESSALSAAGTRRILIAGALLLLCMVAAMAPAVRRRAELLRYRSGKAWFLLRRRLLTPPSLNGNNSNNIQGRILLDRFEVLHEAFDGGFSIVYRAHDRTTGCPVAIKHLKQRLQNREVRTRFSREVATLRSVHHPNVVPVIESWVGSEGDAFIAMPFLAGLTLRHELSAGPIPRHRAAGMIRGIAAALHALGERGVVHRDIKPENIMIVSDASGEATPVLIDFGAAGLAMDRRSLTTTQTLAGSLCYMAPEGLAGHYSRETDVYSLAVVILEMLTGRTLADLSRSVADPMLAAEIEELLGPVCAPNASELASELMRALDPLPANRPPAGCWSATIAAHLGN